MTIKLVKPSLTLKIPFQKLVWDYIEHKDVYFMNKYKPALNDFEAYIDMLAKAAAGEVVESGWVPYTTYWLIETPSDANGSEEVLGNLRVRHKRVDQAGHVGYDIRPSHRGRGLGKKILELGLEEIKSFDFSDVYLTVDQENKSSIRIIETSGGVYQRTFYDDETGETRLEYLIKV